MHLPTLTSELLKSELLKEKSSRPLPTKIHALIVKTLQTCEDPEALVALLRGCVRKDEDVVALCQKAVKELPLDKLNVILKFIIEGEFGAVGKQFLKRVDELRRLDTMRYILRFLESAPDSTREHQRLAVWLRETDLIDVYLRTMLVYPPTTARTIFMRLTRLDNKVPTYLAKLTASLSTEMNQKVLELLELLDLIDRHAATLLIRALIKHEHLVIRARTAYLVGRTFRNPLFIEHVLHDRVPDVRFSLLKSIVEYSHELSPRIIGLLYDALEDPDDRVRATAAQIFYLNKYISGLKTLMSTLHSGTPVGRAYAARLLGELQEVSARDVLKTCAQNDSDQQVRDEAHKALAVLDGQVEVLNQQFDQLQGILTRHLFSAGKKDDLLLWKRLEELDRESIKEMIGAIGLAPDTADQLISIADEVGAQGSVIPLLLSTIVNEDGKVDAEKAADVNLMRREVMRIVEQLQESESDGVPQLLDELTVLQQKTIKAMLIPSLYQENAKVSATAAKTLHELNYDLGSAKLREMVSDADAATRKEAAQVLATIDDQFASEQLEELENDPDPEVQGLAHAGLATVRAKLARHLVPGIQVKIRDVDITGFPTVRFHVRLSDDRGQPLRDLETSDITILEGGKRPVKPKIQSHQNRLPIALAMIMDYSASMSETDISDVETAIRGFIGKLDITEQAAIVKFGQEIHLAQTLTQDKALLDHAIRAEFPLSNEGTSFYDAIFMGTDQLDSAADSLKIIVVNTDGDDTTSERKYDAVAKHATDKNTTVYTVGLGSQVDAKMLQQIARLTQGRYYAASNSGELQGIYESIFQEIRFEYEIVYESKFPQIDEESRGVELCISYGEHLKKYAITLPHSEH
ncbi:MAG: VWA domain-containing protein [Candidatus Poribacteria bacterium]|nr:VWA domain-containing protein [Candidatus Poribacteria bacterium]